MSKSLIRSGETVKLSDLLDEARNHADIVASHMQGLAARPCSVQARTPFLECNSGRACR